MIRLLSVCDVYAAMCQPRGYRALGSRTALTDVLMLADNGGLDRTMRSIFCTYPFTRSARRWSCPTARWALW